MEDFPTKTVPQSRSNPSGKAISALLFACLLLASPGFAETSSPSATAPYRISKGDALRVDIIGRPELSGRFTVESNGTVTLPLIGSVLVAGKTVSDAAGELSGRFALVDRDILRVNLAVAESQNQKVFVLGAVLHPGSYSFLEPTNAWDAIAEAGGTSPDADLSAVEIIPGDTQTGRAVKTIDVDSALRDGTLNTLEPLHPGDAVRVPRGFGAGAVGGGSLIYVFGAVATQGPQPVSAAPDLITAVIRSGGPAPDANLRRVEVARRNGDRITRFKVDMRSYTKEANAAGNLPLQAGDTVFVPRSTGRPTLFTAFGILGPFVALATSIAALSRR